MIVRTIISLAIGRGAAVGVGLVAVLLGGFAGIPGKLLCATYLLPGAALAIPFVPVTDPLFARLFPEGGPPMAMAEVMFFALTLWTLVFGLLHFWWSARRRKRPAALST